MADPLFDMPATETALRRVYEAAGPYLASLADRPVHDPACDPLLDRLGGALPDKGEGAAAVAHRLLEIGTAAGTHVGRAAVLPLRHRRRDAGGAGRRLDRRRCSTRTRSPGPRSAFAHEVETVALDWLRELFGLPHGWGGALVASATFANFTSLGLRHALVGRAARRRRRAAEGLAGLPRMPVLLRRLRARQRPQGVADARATAADAVRCSPATRSAGSTWPRWTAPGRPWTRPAVIIANAGEVNAGDFDPIADLADAGRAARRLAARRRRVRAVRRALAAHGRTWSPGSSGPTPSPRDGHKWLNVPYESGFALIREPARLGAAFGMPGAPYLPGARTRRAAATGCSARSRRGGRGRCRSGRRWPRTGATATGRWSSATSTWRSGWPAWSTRRPTSSGSPTCRCASSASGPRPPGVPEHELDDAQPAGWARRCSTTAGSSPAPPCTTARSRCGRRSSTGAPPRPTSTSVEVVRELAARG